MGRLYPNIWFPGKIDQVLVNGGSNYEQRLVSKLVISIFHIRTYFYSTTTKHEILQISNHNLLWRSLRILSFLFCKYISRYISKYISRYISKYISKYFYSSILKTYLILLNWTESESKQRFSLLQEKVVIQAVCLRTQAVSMKAQF